MTKSIFSAAANPAIAAAVAFMLQTVPHQKGHCWIALPLKSKHLFDIWLTRNAHQFMQDELSGRPTLYTGIALPDPDCGFFGLRFLDNEQSQTGIEAFLREMNMWGTSDYLIIRKARCSRSARALPQHVYKLRHL